MTNILILAAHDARDSRDHGYPICLTEIDRKPLIQHLVEKCALIPNAKIKLAVREEDCKHWHLDNVLRLLSPQAEVLQVRQKTGGAACTALLAISAIHNDEPLLILNGNELIHVDFQHVMDYFLEKECQAGVITFSSIHPRYSYVKINAQGEVTQCAEKNPISQHATVGFYWFKRGDLFVEAAEQMILKNAHVNGQYYICPALNELILRQVRIGMYPIENQQFQPLKSDRQMARLGVVNEA